MLLKIQAKSNTRLEFGKGGFKIFLYYFQVKTYIKPDNFMPACRVMEIESVFYRLDHCNQ